MHSHIKMRIILSPIPTAACRARLERDGIACAPASRCIYQLATGTADPPCMQRTRHREFPTGRSADPA
ncbi:MAG: hypothetical protein ACREFT_09735, partial [Acetobacteraceae bacterium]